MRTAVLAGFIVGGLTAWFGIPCALSNADFIYMCAAAASLDDWHLWVTPYFPPGYPILLWLAVKTGLDALTAGVLFSALGAAFSAGSVAYLARLFKLPAAIALSLALLGASLPDVALISFNPHLDALYTGLAMVFIATAFRLRVDKPHIATKLVFALSAVLLLTLRYHAAIVVIPIVLVILFNPKQTSRRVAILTLVLAATVLGWIYWAQYATYGGFENASLTQVATGRTYRALGEDATQVIFEDYAGWQATASPVETIDVLDGIVVNWPKFMTRKAVLLGFGLLLLSLVATRVWPPRSMLLALFILLYTLAVSPTYFIPRASALTELLSLVLAAAALAVLVPWNVSKENTRKKKPKVDPAIVGACVVLFCITGISYNLWREKGWIDGWQQTRSKVVAVSEVALTYAGGDQSKVYGSIDWNIWPNSKPYNLPGATYSRFWMDDPLVAPLVEPLITRYSPDIVLAGVAPVDVIVLWPNNGSPLEEQLANDLENSRWWIEKKSPVDEARIWGKR